MSKQIRRVFVQPDGLGFRFADSADIACVPFADIVSVHMLLKPSASAPFCKLEHTRDALCFPATIAVNYTDFLNHVSLDSSTNFKAMLVHIDGRAPDRLTREARNWAYHDTPLPRALDTRIPPEARRALARFNAFAIQRQAQRRQPKNRLEIYSYALSGLLLILVGFVYGYKQKIQGDVPLLFLLSIIGLALVIMAFLPKRN